MKQLFTYNENSLELVPVTRNNMLLIKVGIVVSVIMFFVLIMSFTVQPKFNPAALTREERITILSEDDKFTPEKLRDMLHELNFHNEEIVYAQACLETNRFKSHIFLENHNLFGMKVATQRCTTNLGEENGHAAYSTWRESVIDYAMYQNKYLSTLNSAQYFQYLTQYYAEDKSYVKRLHQIITKNKHLF